jgi:protein TonB
MRIAGHQAIYPLEAKARHLEGVVKLHAIIDTDGNATQLTLISSTDPVFVDAAMAAVRTWKYRPYIRNGVPVAVQTNITVNFTFGS